MSPTFDAGKTVETGPGFGCSCLAYRHGEPTPKQALAALARSANVTVEDLGAFRDGTHRFRAWTDPESMYEVTYGPGKHGWCKHCISCLSHWSPWFRQLALGAGDLLKANHELGKEKRKLERQIARLEE